MSEPSRMDNTTQRGTVIEKPKPTNADYNMDQEPETADDFKR